MWHGLQSSARLSQLLSYKHLLVRVKAVKENAGRRKIYYATTTDKIGPENSKAYHALPIERLELMTAKQSKLTVLARRR